MVSDAPGPSASIRSKPSWRRQMLPCPPTTNQISSTVRWITACDTAPAGNSKCAMLPTLRRNSRRTAVPSGAVASGSSPRVLVSKGLAVVAVADRRGVRPRCLGEAFGGLLRGDMTSPTLTANEALDEFRAAGALLTGHFILSSGLHSPVFLQKVFVFQDPVRTERLCRALAVKAREAFGPIDVVASPALGGLGPGYETARWLGAKAIFVEREGGAFKLRRGFSVAAGARVLMVEDIITTGLSSRETLAALAEHPGTIVGAACLIDRSDGQADIGVQRVGLG